MTIINGYYNIPHVSLGSITSGVKTEVGTKEDFDKIMNLITNSGLIYVSCSLDDYPMVGHGICNPYHAFDGIEVGFITAAGNNVPRVMVAQLTLESDKCYVTVRVPQ